MNNVALKYSGTKLNNLVFDINAIQQKIFNNLNISKPFINNTVESGISLNGKKYSHLLYKHIEYDVTFSADTLDSSGVSFIENWRSSLFKYLSVEIDGSFTNYFEVIIEGGRLPLTFLENLEYLPEISFTISKKEKE